MPGSWQEATGRYNGPGWREEIPPRLQFTNRPPAAKNVPGPAREKEGRTTNNKSPRLYSARGS